MHKKNCHKIHINSFLLSGTMVYYDCQILSAPIFIVIKTQNFNTANSKCFTVVCDISDIL